MMSNEMHHRWPELRRTVLAIAATITATLAQMVLPQEFSLLIGSLLYPLGAAAGALLVHRTWGLGTALLQSGAYYYVGRSHGIETTVLIYNVLAVLSASALIVVLVGYLQEKMRTNIRTLVTQFEELSVRHRGDSQRLATIETKLSRQEALARLLARSEPAQHAVDAPSMPRGVSAQIEQVRARIQKVAPTEATVLIFGESGVGKERVAKAIHELSARSQHPFVAVNCGAIPENLIESELFGHKKGAFTGADRDTAGLFRAAGDGTIFLDEIGELPLAMQAKLLRVLQERTVRAVGADHDLPMRARIVAATNRDLQRGVTQGTFREDLFYRLQVVEIEVPPLRERTDDIPMLIELFVRKFARPESAPVVSPTAMDILLRYPYPGNIRELENIVERATVLGGDAILPEHLPPAVHRWMNRDARREVEQRADRSTTQILELEGITLPAKLDEILENIERAYLEKALQASQGKKKQAAELLGVNFRSMRYRLAKFDLRDS